MGTQDTPTAESTNSIKDEDSRNATGEVSSAPNTKASTVTPDIQQIVHDCTKKSNSFVESKYKITLTSDRLLQLRRLVECATKDHKVFTIRGVWPVIRRELIRRGWLEKVEQANKQKFANLEDVTSNLPSKQDWESHQSYTEKCEKMVISRMLQNYDCDFYWSMRKEPVDLQHRANAFKLINRFSRSLFASKEGLALLLQQHYWFTETGVASINYPRVYVLGFPDHYNMFVDDFRTTACMGFLKCFAERYETGDKYDIQSPDGKVPYAALQFAIDRCNDYIASQKHLDLDKDFARIWDHEWEQFLTNYYIIVHEKGLFCDFSEPLKTVYATVRSTLKDMQRFWPQYDIDGMKNIWILKPGNKCRGRGIQLVKNLADVEKAMGLKLKYVVQKYIERPLIIYKTKFDIRQWFMVTSVQPLTIWMYRDSYLRFSGQNFSLEDFHESLHLTNHAVQCKYRNTDARDKLLPDDNMWDCHSFKAYLKSIGHMEKWNEVIYPGMKESIICAMLASQDTMDRRQNTFEIYGADFMLGEDFRTWLIEVNCSPDLSFSTTVTARLCPQCMEDIIKVVVDKRKDPNADTGLFDLVYKQNYPRAPPYLGMNLSVRGRKIFRSKSKSKSEKSEKEKALVRLRRNDFVKSEFIKDTAITRILPKLISPESYQGPVIEDFIEELSRSVSCDQDCGVDFVPVVKPERKLKSDRVAKRVSTKAKSNTSSIYRRQNARENTTRASSSSCQGKLTMSVARVTWGKEGGCLKGTNIFNKYTPREDSADANKNYLNRNCFAEFNLNTMMSGLACKGK